jgi:NTE family protein
VLDKHRLGSKLIGLALGSGSARGLAHIGVIRGLSEAGIEPGVVCGTSIGALVGAVYASGRLDLLDSWARNLNTRDIIRYMDIKLVVGGGFADGKRLIDFFRERIGDISIEALSKPFAAVATDLNTGQEFWIREGSLWDAVRASIAMPGILTPARLNNHWLVDGGLVNPVPVFVCRAMEAEAVIAVNLNGDIVGRHLTERRDEIQKSKHASTETTLLNKLSAGLRERANFFVSRLEPSVVGPGLFNVLAGSLNIMQDRITRSRLAEEPPDILLAPRLADMGLLEFDRAAEAIEEGRACVRRTLTPVRDDVER